MVFNKIRYSIQFLIAMSFGLFGVAYDWDHIATLVIKGLPVTWYNLSTQASRFAHWPTFILLGIICGGYSAYVFRLYYNPNKNSRGS